MRGLRSGRHPLFQSFQTICIDTKVLPVPVAIVSRSRFVAPEDRRGRTVDRGLLVVAGLLHATVGVVECSIEGHDDPVGHRLLGDALPGAVPRPQLLWAREGDELVGLDAGVAVVLDNALAVSRVDEGEVEPPGIVLRLL